MKKLLSMILTVAMIFSILPHIVMADGDTIISIEAGPGSQDVNHTGMVVEPQISVVSGDKPASYKYQWYAENNTTGDEYILPWETGASITIHSQIPSGWWLNFEATPLDSEGNAIGDSVKSNHYISTYPMKGKNDIPEITKEQSTAWHDTPSEYLFEVDGVKFILLDRLYNGEYYVMMEESVGKRAFDTRGAGNAFDPTASENIGYWLNNDFLVGEYLPASVKSYITEENWTTEGDHPDWGNSNKTYKVGLLSYSEYIRYLGRFGLWVSDYDASNPNGWEGFWLRTRRNDNQVYASAKNGGISDGTGILGKLGYYDPTNSAMSVRPTFRLDENFFEDVTVDNPGRKIREILGMKDTVISITAGPGYQDVSHTGMVVEPQIDVVSGDEPASYKYQWYTQNGNSTEYILPWETGASITIHSQIPSGWWLNFEATPLDSEGNAIGDSVKSNHYISTYPMKGRNDIPEITKEQSTAWHNTPSEYLFEVDGVKFILLDRLYNGEYYVMMEESVGKRAFDTRGTGKAFDPTASENIGYWLNNDFLSGNYLPAQVKSHITEENWNSEGDKPEWGNSSKTYKVGLLSYSEYIQYLGRFGLWVSDYDASNPNGWEGFWLRTRRNDNQVYASAKNGGISDGTGILGTLGYYAPTNSAMSVRPTFRLDEDFFENVKVTNAGAKVREILKQYETVLEIQNIPGYQDNVNHNALTVTPTVNVSKGQAPAKYKYQWYVGENGENILPWETGASITINSQIPSGAWLWFEVTPLDSDGDAIGDSVKARYISTYPMKGRNDIPEITKEQSTAWYDTPSEYLFEVDGVKFILLDRLYNGECYVMMEESVGKRAFDTRGYGHAFSATDPKNIGYWLNNDFLAGSYLPASVKSYITEESWNNEGDHVDWGNSTSDPYKVGLLSYSEFVKYLGRFGLWLSDYDAKYPRSWEGFWLRTRRNDQQVYASSKNGGTNSGAGILGTLGYYDPKNSAMSVRPTFRLSEDFFKNVKVENYGEKVKEVLDDIYAKHEDTVISIAKGPGYQSDVNHNGMTVTPEIYVVSGTTPGGYKYQWYAQDGNSTEYILPWETGESITINSQIPAGWWLNFEATPLDFYGNAIGDTVKVNHYISTYPMKGSLDIPEITKEQSAAWRDTPSEYLFEVDGVKFILLDRLYNGEYYVMMEESVGKRAFDTRGEGYAFDSTASQNIGYWLNNDFLSGSYLPASVKSHITEENWNSEGDKPEWANSSKTYKVGLLSYSEYVQYLGRFGLWLSDYDAEYPLSWEGFWLRTRRNDQRVYASAKNGGTNDGSGIMGSLGYYAPTNDTYLYVRPTFRLAADFFEDVKVDTSTMGDRIKNMLATDYTLNELRSVYTEAELAKIIFTVSSAAGNDIGVVYPQNEAYFDVTITSRYDEAANVTVSVQVTGASTYSKSEELTCLPGETKYHIDLQSLKCGAHNVTINVAENGSVFYSKTNDFNIVKAQPEIAGYRTMNLGVNNRIEEKDILLAEKLGISHIRWLPEWDTIEKSKGEYSFSLRDKEFQLLKEHGFEITCLLGFANPLYYEEENENPYASDTDKFALTTEEQKNAFVNYCCKIVERYGEGLKAVEIWNEPNNKSCWNEDKQADYFDLSGRVIDAIKKINPSLPIYVGSIDVSRSGTTFMNEMLASGLYAKCDGISYHPYYHYPQATTVADTNFIAKVNSYNDILYNYGGWKTMPLTEIGYQTGSSGGDLTVEPKAAREVIKSIIFAQMNHQENILMYCLRDLREINEFGAFDVNYRVTDTAYALAQYESVLGDAVYFGKIDAGNSKISAHLFRKDGEWVVVAWTTSGTVSYKPSGLSKAEDYYGNAKSVSGGAVSLGVEPTYLFGFSDSNAKTMVTQIVNSAYSDIKSEYSLNNSQVNTLTSSISSGLPTNAENILSLAKNHYSVGLSQIGSMSGTTQNKMAFLFKWQHIGEVLCRWYGVFADDMPDVVSYQRSLASAANNDNTYSYAIAEYALRYAKDAQGYRNAGQSGFAAGAELNADLLLYWANSIEGTANDVTVSAKEDGANVTIFGTGTASVRTAFYDDNGAVISVQDLTLTGTEANGVATEFVSCPEYSTVKLFRWNDMEPLWALQRDSR